MKNTAESFKASVVSMGNPLVDGRRPCNMRPVTTANLLEYIDSVVRDERVKEEVKKMAWAYPAQALWAFKKNIRLHIEKAQKTVALTPIQKGELGDEPQKVKGQELDCLRDITDEFN